MPAKKEKLGKEGHIREKEGRSGLFQLRVKGKILNSAL